MAYYLTGRQRTLVMSGNIVGHGHAVPLMAIPQVYCSTRIKVSLNWGYAGITPIELTGEVDTTISAGLTVTATNGWGASQTVTNRPQSLPWDQDCSGTWEISIDVEECMVESGHPANDGVGYPKIYYQSSAPSVVDLPLGNVLTLYEQTRVSGTITATITMGGLTATATSAITSNVALPMEYPVYRRVYTGSYGMGNVSQCTLAFLDFAEETYSRSNGTASCTCNSVTTTGTGDGTLEATCSPPRSFIVEGSLLSDWEPWPGSGTVRLTRKVGETYYSLPAIDRWGYTFNQRSVNYSSTLNSTAQTALVIQEHVPYENWLVPNAPDSEYEWRMLQLGWEYPAFDLGQAAYVNIDGGYTVGLGTTVTRTLTTCSLNGYRYLQLDCGVGAALATFTLAIGVKQWSCECDSSGIALVDLCSPNNAAVSVDTLTCRWPWPVDVDTVSGDGALWGCERITGYTISGSSAGLAVPANGVQLVRVDHSLFCVQPTFQHEYADGTGVMRRQFVVADTDGRRSYENEDGYWLWDAPQQDDIHTFVDEVGTVDSGYVRHRGWSATLKAAVDVADGSTGSAMRYGYLNRNRPATWIWGGGAMWSVQDGVGAWYYGIDANATATRSVSAQALYDRIDWYPGVGDAFGHRSGTHQYEYCDSMGRYGAIELRTQRYLRSAVVGVALHGSTAKPLVGATVAVLEATGHASAGSGETDIRGEYLTAEPYPYHNSSFDTQLQVGAPRPEATLTLYSRSRQRVAFRGTPASAGISYDVSDAMRHIRAFIDAGTIWIQSAATVDPRVWDPAVDTGVTADRACVRYERAKPNQAVLITYAASGTVYARATADEGRSVSMATTIGSGDYPAMVSCRDGLQAVYWVTGSAIHGVLFDGAGNRIKLEFTAVASGVDAAQIAAEEYVSGRGVRGIALLYRSTGTLVTKVSTDGVVFT